VLEGTASVLVGTEVVEVKAGGWHVRPRMLKHTFWNAGKTPLRFVDMYFNQSFEKYLERIFQELTEAKGYPDGSEKKARELNALNTQYGVIFPDGCFQEMEAIKKQYGLK
jgi:oxalate decarboxylase/phosphoglucose isomerase-like protein (cupin superfamily)